MKLSRCRTVRIWVCLTRQLDNMSEELRMRKLHQKMLEIFKVAPQNLIFMSSVLHACAMDDILRGGDFVTHSLTHSPTPMLVRCVTAGYAMQAPFKFSSKSIGFPRAKHHMGFIFSCENLTDIGQISLLWKCQPQEILNQK